MKTKDLGGQIETLALSLVFLLPAHRAVEALLSHRLSTVTFTQHRPEGIAKPTGD